MASRKMGIRRLVAAISLVGATMLLATMISGAAPAGADTVHPLSFGPQVVLPQSGVTGSTSKTCYNPCGEPSLIVAPDDTMYVSTPRTILICCNSKASPVWKSTDGGTTWGNPIFPAAPVNNNLNATTGGDTELAVDSKGTVYEGELWLGDDSIYISGDKGATWSWSPLSHDVLDDREWLVYNQKDNSIYAQYDGFKGIMMTRVPLDTPLGTDAARFAPIERVMIPECPVGLAANCPSIPVDNIGGTPVIDGTTSPGRPAVDQNSGTVYFPDPFQTKGKGIVVASTSDGGQTFQYNYVTGSGGGQLGDTGNDFPVAAVDQAGNVYVAWSENQGSGFTIYLSVSKDHAATWSTPIPVSQGISGTAIFPNIVAGADGRVAVSWFGTSTVGDSNTITDAVWDVDVAQTLDASDATPSFTYAVAAPSFHKGVICTNGTGCSGDSRKLLDFFDMQIDRISGALAVVYARDKNGVLGGAGTDIAFQKQTDGCSLTQPGVYLGPGVDASPGTPPTAC